MWPLPGKKKKKKKSFIGVVSIMVPEKTDLTSLLPYWTGRYASGMTDWELQSDDFPLIVVNTEK